MSIFVIRFKLLTLFFLSICLSHGFASPASPTEPTKDQAILVLGCGNNHNPMTCAGFPHDHSEDNAITINEVSESERFTVSNPTFVGNAFDQKVWDHFEANQFSRITAESIPLFRDPHIERVRQYYQAELNALGGEPNDLITNALIKKARKVIEATRYIFLINQCETYLKPGGQLIMQPSFAMGARYDRPFQNLVDAFGNGESSFEALHAAMTTLNDLQFVLTKAADIFESVRIEYYKLHGEYPYSSNQLIEQFEYSFETQELKEISFENSNIQFQDEDVSISDDKTHLPTYVALTYTKKS